MSGLVESSIIPISMLTTLLGTLGFSLAFKDYIASLIGGIIIRRVKNLKIGTRIKILVTPIIKGDIIKTGLFTTLLEEVGDGNRLSSIKTGRILKVPNFLLVSNPVVIYGDKITDEVIVYVKNKPEYTRILLDNMKRAIEEEGYKVIDVNIVQHEDKLSIHGIFESDTKRMADIRRRIKERYLSMIDKELVSD